MYKRILFLLIIILFSVTGCKRKQNDIIETKVLVKDMDMDNLGVLLNFYKVNSSDRFALLWENDIAKEYDDIFLPATADNVPSKAVERIASKLGFQDTFLEINESLFFYDKQEEYELFLAENREKKQWKLYFLYGEDFKEVVIQNKEDLYIDDYQIEDDCIYLFSKNIYKVDLNDYSTEIILDEESSFELGGTGELAFIYGQSFISPVNMYGDNEEYTGIYRVYNFETKEVRQMEEKDYINKVFPYKDGFIALCSKNVTWNPCIKYFNNKFEFLEEKAIDISSKDGNVVIGLLVHRGYMIDNKIYSIMMVDGSHTREIVVIDADSAKVLYQAEIRFKNRNGFTLSGPDYFIVNEELTNLKEFN